MDEEEEERRGKKARLAEYKEYDKVLQILDHHDHHDLAAHLLNAAMHRAKHRERVMKKKAEGSRRKSGRPPNDESLRVNDIWTAWPLPPSIVPRPVPLPSSSTTEIEQHDSDALHAEIEAAILRIARSRIKADGGKVSANEHAPYQVTREVTSQVMSKFNQLLHALGRVKYQQVDSERIRKRLQKSQWDEIITMADLIGTTNTETTERIRKRCEELFNKIPGQTNTQEQTE